MHLLLLGVVRRVCKYFFTDQTIRLRCRLSSLQKEDISNQISTLSKCLPGIFSRRLRGLSEFSNYKAVEYRTFLLYFSPILLKRHLPRRFYNHFLLLHFAVYCLCSSDSSELINVAEACLMRFQQEGSELYGPTLFSYNVHVLSHLTKYVRMYGKLDSFSAFPFENYLRLIKSRLRCSTNIDKQVINIMSMIRQLYHRPQSNFCVTDKSPDNCVLCSDGSVVLVTNCSSEHLVSGNKLVFRDDLYSFPYSSSHLKIGYYQLTSAHVTGLSVERQCILIPHGPDYIVIPIAHSSIKKIYHTRFFYCYTCTIGIIMYYCRNYQT